MNSPRFLTELDEWAAMRQLWPQNRRRARLGSAALYALFGASPPGSRGERSSSSSATAGCAGRLPSGSATNPVLIQAVSSSSTRAHPQFRDPRRPER